MGRGSGSHSGGGHSGGRSFGGRSSGGRSGGFGGSGRGPGGPGFGGPPPGGPHGPGFGGPRFGGPWFGGPRRIWFGPVFRGGGWGRPGGGGCGCFTSIIIVILLLIVFTRFTPSFSSTQENTNVAISRTERTAITGTNTYKDWYVDELNFIDHDTDLTDGLKYFYSKTGIQPYVMLLDYDSSIWTNGKWNETAADEYLAQIYKDTFSDNGHMILAYFACENDSEDMDGEFYLYYGSDAFSIMDAEAEDIFWSYFYMNYNNLDLNISEFIGQTFHETADNIMHVESNGNSGLFRAITIFCVICVIVIIVGIIVAKKSNSKEDFQ